MRGSEESIPVFRKVLKNKEGAKVTVSTEYNGVLETTLTIAGVYSDIKYIFYTEKEESAGTDMFGYLYSHVLKINSKLSKDCAYNGSIEFLEFFTQSVDKLLNNLVYNK